MVYEKSSHFRTRHCLLEMQLFRFQSEIHLFLFLKPLDTFGKQYCPKPKRRVSQLLYKITNCENLGLIGRQSREKITGKPTFVSARFAVS